MANASRDAATLLHHHIIRIISIYFFKFEKKKKTSYMILLRFFEVDNTMIHGVSFPFLSPPGGWKWTSRRGPEANAPF